MKRRVCTALALALATSVHADSLDDAFRRERGMLLAERDALRASLDRERARVTDREAELHEWLESVTDSVHAVESQVAALRQELDAAALNPRAMSAAAALTNATLVLRDANVTVPDMPADSVTQRVTALVARSLDAIEQASTVHVEDGVFFDENGRERSGSIIHIGRVARLAAGDGAGGVLAPTGGDGWRVVDAGAAHVADALREGRSVSTVPLFLTDPLLGAAEATRDRTLRDVLAAGGLIVWPILLLAFVALVIIVDRAFRVLQARRNARAFQVWSDAEGSSRSPDWTALETQCLATPGPFSRVLESALSNRGASSDVLEGVIDEAVMEETERLDRFLPSLRAIAAVAPLLGLLGTVTGMIRTFDVITDFGTGNPKLLSGGISEALITTEVGLAVAIPTLLIYSVLAGAVDGVAGDMERRGLRVGLALKRSNTNDGAV